MNKPFNNQVRTRLKQLAGMIEQKRRDATKNGQGKGIAPTPNQNKSADSMRFFHRRN